MRSWSSRVPGGSSRWEPAARGPGWRLTDPTGTTRRLPAFRVVSGAPAARYASGVPGEHVARWLDPRGAPTGVEERIEVSDEPGPGPLDRHGPIRVASDGTHFEHEDGTPFLWLADTWWHALSPRITDEELRALAIQRVAQGFTAVQLVVGPLPEVREGRAARRSPWVASRGSPGGARSDPSTSRRRTAASSIILAAGLVPSSWAPGATTSTTRAWR